MKKGALYLKWWVATLLLVCASLALLPVNLKAQVVLDNNKLRFGTGFEASVNANGHLQQPFYYHAVQRAWRKLTFSAYSLETAIGVGSNKSEEWNTSGSIVQNPVLSNQVMDFSGFVLTGEATGTRGYGTVVSRGNITVDGNLLEVQNTYELPKNSAYLKVTTQIRNINDSKVKNLRLWLGTRDDWVGTTDVPAKTKGNLVDGVFVPLANTGERATALQISSGAEGVLLYTNAPTGNTIIQECCDFNNIINQNPSTSPSNSSGDASYGFYVRMNDLDAGERDSFSWYYGAGVLSLLPEIIVDVAAATAGFSYIGYTTATFNATAAAAATAYWMVVPRNAAKPTAAQIKAGTDYGPVAVTASGSGPMSANAAQAFALSGLAAGAAYDFYFVSEKAASDKGDVKGDAETAFSNLLKVPFATQAYTMPVVSTTAPTTLTQAGALSGGIVTSDGGTAVISRGVSWSTTGIPTIGNYKTADGMGNGPFSSALTNLTPNTTYFIRAYATNAAGTAYGNLVSFKTSPANLTSLSLSADNLCVGSSAKLTAYGAQGTVYWYAGACGSAAIGTGPAITVSPTVTTTYYARNFNGSFSDCIPLTLTVNKEAPVAVGKDLTVNLGADLAASVSAAALDNGSHVACGPLSLAITSGKTAYDCADIGKTYPVILTATDQQGNQASDTVAVTIADPQSNCNQAPVAVAIAVTATAGADCQVPVAAAAFDGGSTDADGDALTFTVYPAGPYTLGTTLVTFTVTDPDGASSSGQTTITVVDTTPPVLAALSPIAVSTDAGVNGATVHYLTPVGMDHCRVTTVQTAGLASGSLFPVGTTTNTFQARDDAGNVATTSFTVTVTDTEAPLAVAQNIAVRLDAAGMAAIAVDQVNNGSSDNCSLASLHLSKTLFDCSNIGANPVVLTVTDASGNVSTATAMVVVDDKLAPTVLTQHVTINLGADGKARITAAQIDKGSTDACGIAAVEVDKTNFDCSDIGANTVILKVTDVHGNTSTATAVITVKDVTPPVAKANFLHFVTLRNGVASITGAELNCGSTDVCGIASYAVSPAIFTCADIGLNKVTLTVTDRGGNISTATATVFVLGLPPVSWIRVVKCEHRHCTSYRCDHSHCDDRHCRDKHSDHKHGDHDDDDDCDENDRSDYAGHCGHRDHRYHSDHIGRCGYTSHLDNGHKSSCSSYPGSSLPTKLDKKTIYLGYGEQTVILDATGGLGLGSTYAWTGNGKLSSTTSGRPEFAPKSPGTYTFTVVETNPFGCKASSSVTIIVVDVQAKDKIALCHNGQGISVAQSAVPAHLAHGDKLGTCAVKGNANARMETMVDYATELVLVAYPNPALDKTNIEFTTVEAGSYRLALFDLKGALVKDIATGKAESNKFFSYELDARAYPVGVYLIRLTTDQEVVTRRLIIER